MQRRQRCVARRGGGRPARKARAEESLAHAVADGDVTGIATAMCDVRFAICDCDCSCGCLPTVRCALPFSRHLSMSPSDVTTCAQCSAVQRSAVLRSAAQSRTEQRSAAQCSTTQCSAAQCSAAHLQCSIEQCAALCTACYPRLYCTAMPAAAATLEPRAVRAAIRQAVRNRAQ
jgi:hypothetical protein